MQHIRGPLWIVAHERSSARRLERTFSETLNHIEEYIWSGMVTVCVHASWHLSSEIDDEKSVVCTPCEWYEWCTPGKCVFILPTCSTTQRLTFFFNVHLVSIQRNKRNSCHKSTLMFVSDKSHSYSSQIILWLIFHCQCGFNGRI